VTRTALLRTALLAGSASLTVSGVAAASSHREAPSIAADPSADNTDVYAWVQGQDLVIVADYIGLELPEGGPSWASFSPDVRYDIHVVRGGTSLAEVLTYQIQFSNTAVPAGNPAASPPTPGPTLSGLEFFGQLSGPLGKGSGAFGQTYSVTQLTNGASPTVIATGVPVPPPNVGPETNLVAYGIPAGTTYESFFVDSGYATGMLAGGGQVFAGPRDDPFWVDLGAVFDLAQLRPVEDPLAAARDSLAYMNVHAIVLQIPLAVANGGTAPVMGTASTAQTVGVWASASRRKSTIRRRRGGAASSYGPWIQVSRAGLPLINEVIIGLQDKDRWNRLTPADDVPVFAAYIEDPILVRDAQAVGLYLTGGPLDGPTCDSGMGGKDLETARVDILNAINLAPAHNILLVATGDVLRVDLGLPSGFPNGRLLTDEVVDLELGLLLCGAANITGLLGLAGPVGNEPEAPLPKGGATPAFPYLEPPWEGRSASPRLAPSVLSQSGQRCTASTSCASGVCLGAGTCQ
jgi:hypothetical protein